MMLGSIFIFSSVSLAVVHCEKKVKACGRTGKLPTATAEVFINFLRDCGFAIIFVFYANKSKTQLLPAMGRTGMSALLRYLIGIYQSV